VRVYCGEACDGSGKVDDRHGAKAPRERSRNRGGFGRLSIVVWQIRGPYAVRVQRRSARMICERGLRNWDGLGRLPLVVGIGLRTLRGACTAARREGGFMRWFEELPASVAGLRTVGRRPYQEARGFGLRLRCKAAARRYERGKSGRSRRPRP
jgi:hypothetical protein